LEARSSLCVCWGMVYREEPDGEHDGHAEHRKEKRDEHREKHGHESHERTGHTSKLVAWHKNPVHDDFKFSEGRAR
jgi:hypothetical protein